MRDVRTSADELLEAMDADLDCRGNERVRAAVTALRLALEHTDRAVDRTHGRLHDCAGCLRKEKQGADQVLGEMFDAIQTTSQEG